MDNLDRLEQKMDTLNALVPALRKEIEAAGLKVTNVYNGDLDTDPEIETNMGSIQIAGRAAFYAVKSTLGGSLSMHGPFRSIVTCAEVLKNE